VAEGGSLLCRCSTTIMSYRHYLVSQHLFSALRATAAPLQSPAKAGCRAGQRKPPLQDALFFNRLSGGGSYVGKIYKRKIKWKQYIKRASAAMNNAQVTHSWSGFGVLSLAIRRQGSEYNLLSVESGQYN
ncbi:hypothetical protein, partial [Siminovitchia terrae]|uniref:hypothetical protein n=1 Tax=Siminovitchia terrae TaxID=1914933 RepID=UPI0028B0C791